MFTCLSDNTWISGHIVWTKKDGHVVITVYISVILPGQIFGNTMMLNKQNTMLSSTQNGMPSESQYPMEKKQSIHDHDQVSLLNIINYLIKNETKNFVEYSTSNKIPIFYFKRLGSMHHVIY